MNRNNETFEAKLCADTIDAVSEKIRSFLTECKLPKREVLRYAMSAEEILLKTSESTDEEHTVKLSMGTRFFRKIIMLEIDGSADNVYAEQESDSGVLCGGILKNLGISPEYSYVGEKNRYLFRIKKKSANQFVSLMIALFAALVVGALSFTINSGLRDTLTESVLTPLNDVFLNVLSCIAGPMIFLSVAWGIYGIGDAATLKRIGKKLILSYTGEIFAAVIIIGFACLPLFSFDFSGGAGGGSEISSVFNMLLGIVPKDIFSPFVNGNTLQIIFLAVLVGIAMLFLGRKTEFIAVVVEQINYIVQFLIEAISKLVPYFIFIVLLKMVWGNALSSLAGIGKLIAVFIGTALLNAAAVVLYASVKNRVNPLLIIKKALPTFIIAVTTASSAAAFGTNMNTCRREFGIDEKISSFGIPLGMVTFKPHTALSYMIASLFFAEKYKLNISFSWVAVMMITVGILAIATPPIPGGAMTAYTVLFSQLGIPGEALVIALACDAVFDFISTGFDQFLMPIVLLCQANKLGMVDRNILQNHKKEQKEN